MVEPQVLFAILRCCAGVRGVQDGGRYHARPTLAPRLATCALFFLRAPRLPVAFFSPFLSCGIISGWEPGKIIKMVKRQKDPETRKTSAIFLQITREICGGQISQPEFLDLLKPPFMRWLGNQYNVLIIYTVVRDVERKGFFWFISVGMKYFRPALESLLKTPRLGTKLGH